MRLWSYIVIGLSIASATAILLALTPAISATTTNDLGTDTQTHRSGYGLVLHPKHSVNFSHYVGHQQVLVIDVKAQEQDDDELHAILTDSQGRMVMSKFFKGSLHEVMRFGYDGPYAFVLGNGGDSPAFVEVSLESSHMSKFPEGVGLPITLPKDVLP